MFSCTKQGSARKPSTWNIIRRRHLAIPHGRSRVGSRVAPPKNGQGLEARLTAQPPIFTTIPALGRQRSLHLRVDKKRAAFECTVFDTCNNFTTQHHFQAFSRLPVSLAV